MSSFYNDESVEDLKDAKIINGNPSGIVSFSLTPHKWAVGIYDLMQSYTWYVKECNISSDKNSYNNLPEEHKDAFDLVLAQLITDDSVQTRQLNVGISDFITSPVVSAVITRQSYEEVEHVNTYSIIVDELCGDPERIFNMQNHNADLREKNRAVINMYQSLGFKDQVNTVEDKLLIFAANQILEQIVFPGGFIVMWSFNMPGVSKAISFIERDETGTHVPLFKNIFRTAIRENGPMEQSTIDKIVNMVKIMVDAEIKWTTTISKDLPGFTHTAIKMFIENHGNSVMSNLKLPPIYEVTDGGPLMSIYNANSMLAVSKNGTALSTKTNGFEVPISDYSVNTVNMDF